VSATLIGPPAQTPGGAGETGRAPGKEHTRLGDRPVLIALALCFAAITALTWRKWGVPEIDAGAELTTADLIKHGAIAYKDVRYYYGPFGLYSLALAFDLLGTSFTVAFAFGLAQTAAILAVFYVLARHWLAPLVAGLATAVLMAIGFSGTAFNFILPHTNSATFGLLGLLAMLLALTRDRMWWAGIALGAIGLTRPEFFAVAGAGCIAYLAALWRTEGRPAALAGAWRIALPGIVIPALVLGWFAEQAGLSRLATENLWPVKFVHSGTKTQSNWMPVSISGLLGLLARGALYGGLLGGLVAGVIGWRRRAGAKRLLALWPLAAVLACAGILDGLSRASGLASGERAAIELECRHLVLGMSWLPALGVAVALAAAVQLRRRGSSPLGGTWPADLALIVTGAILGLRAYNAFTAEGSYAPYYAAPLVLMLGILHAQIAARWPQARLASMAALAAVAVGLAGYALGGLYIHDSTTVHTARGSFVTNAASATALQGAVTAIDADTRPGSPILAAPTDGGLYFMADRPPALYELTILPGLIDSPAEEAAAISELERKHVELAAIGARDLSIWGTPTFGVDYNAQIGNYLRTRTRSASTVGTLADPVGGTNPSKGFRIIRLRG